MRFIFLELKKEIFEFISKNVSCPVREIKNTVKDLENMTKKQSGAPKTALNYYSFNDFKEEYHYEFPLQNDEDFENFNVDILKNLKNIKTNLKSHLICMILPHEDLLDQIRAIIKKFFARDVLKLYIAQKQGTGKKVFKEAAFYTVLHDAVHSAYAEVQKKIEEKNILDSISTAFSNVKDWNKGRSDRLKKSLQQITNQ